MTGDHLQYTYTCNAHNRAAKGETAVNNPGRRPIDDTRFTSEDAQTRRVGRAELPLPCQNGDGEARGCAIAADCKGTQLARSLVPGEPMNLACASVAMAQSLPDGLLTTEKSAIQKSAPALFCLCDMRRITQGRQLPV